MADQAFDAFSQRRETGTKDRVTERRRVDTLTDPNRYVMPPRRRLGVVASNKSMFVAPEKSNITAFAEGLSKIQPEIMDYITSKNAAENQKQIEYGIQEAMGKAATEAGDTEFIDNEWKTFGYEQQTAFLLGEEIGTKLELDASNRDLNEDYDTWYQRWWDETNQGNPAISTMNPEHIGSFNKALSKSVTKAQSMDMIAVDKKIDNEQKATASEVIYKNYEELYKQGNINEEAWIAMKKDLTYLNRLSHKEQTDIKVATLIKIATDPKNLDKSALDVLLKPGLGIQKDPNGIDQVTEMPNSLYHDPEYHKDIRAAIEKIARDKLAKDNAAFTAKQREKTVYNEFESDGYKEVTDFIGYDPAIVLKMDPKARSVAIRLEKLGKDLFTKHYDANIANKMDHKAAMEKAVEVVKDQMYMYESPGGFEAQQEFNRWFNDTNFKIQETINSDIGKAKLVEVYATEGEAGFTRMFGKLDQEQLDQIYDVAVGRTSDLKIEARKAESKTDKKLEVAAAKGRKKKEYAETSMTYPEKSADFNVEFDRLKARPGNSELTSEQIYNWMMKQDKYKNL